jgi:hypothetical protein
MWSGANHFTTTRPHRMLADHLTTEYSVRIDSRGRVVDE